MYLLEHVVAFLLTKSVAEADHGLLQLVPGDTPIAIVIKGPENSGSLVRNLSKQIIASIFGQKKTIPEGRLDVVHPISLLLHRHHSHAKEIFCGQLPLPVALGLADQGYDVVLGRVLAQGPEDVADVFGRNGLHSLKNTERTICWSTHPAADSADISHHQDNYCSFQAWSARSSHKNPKV